MKKTSLFLHLGLVFGSTLLQARAANGTWTNTASGGLWSDSANWSGGTIADASTFNANFNTLDLPADNTIHLDTARTISSLTFGDLNSVSAAGWLLDNHGNPANILTLGATPTVTVNTLGTEKNVTISAILAGTAGLVKTGAGPLVLSGANTLSGAVNVNGGSLDISPGGTLNAGGGRVDIGNGGGGVTSTMTVSGGTLTTTNLFVMGNNTGVGGGANYTQTGGTVNTGQMYIGNNTNGVSNLTISGGSFTTNAGVVTIGQAANANLTVTGGTFTATTNYLVIGATSAASGIIAQSGGAINLGTQTVYASNFGTASTASALNLSGGTFTAGIFHQGVRGNSALSVSGTASVSLGTLSMGHPLGDAVGTRTVNLTGGTLTSTNGIVYGLGTHAVNLNGGTLQAGSSSFVWANSANVTASIGASGITFDSQAFNATTAQNLGGTGALTKTGSGKWTLSGANTYSGNTTVNTGTLALADNAQLKFVLGAISGSNNSLSGGGTATLEGDFVIDTTAANSLTTGSWTLVNVMSLAAGFEPTFSVVGFMDAGGNKWTKSVGAKLWTFDEATGVLTLKTLLYKAWLETFFPGETSSAIVGTTADPDHDGIPNGVEIVLGGNPATGMDSAWNPTIELVNDDVGHGATDYLLFTYRRSDLSVAAEVAAGAEVDDDLAGSWTSTAGIDGTVVVETDNFYSVSPGIDRVRVYVPRGGNTKLFGRLKVATP